MRRGAPAEVLSENLLDGCRRRRPLQFVVPMRNGVREAEKFGNLTRYSRTPKLDPESLKYDPDCANFLEI
jgi:hypothetical protein